MEQSAISTARQQPVTEHVQEAAEDVSVWTVMNSTRRRCGVSCDSGAGYKCHDLLTYLHSSSGTGRSSHFGNNESSQAINGKLITAMIPKTDNVNKTTEMQHAREHVIAL